MKRRNILCVLACSLVTMPAIAQTAGTPPAGRLLASNCFQCHGINGGGGVEKIAGKSASEIVKELKEMQQKSPPKMMDMHARGHTDAEITC